MTHWAPGTFWDSLFLLQVSCHRDAGQWLLRVRSREGDPARGARSRARKGNTRGWEWIKLWWLWVHEFMSDDFKFFSQYVNRNNHTALIVDVRACRAMFLITPQTHVPYILHIFVGLFAKHHIARIPKSCYTLEKTGRFWKRAFWRRLNFAPPDLCLLLHRWLSLLVWTWERFCGWRPPLLAKFASISQILTHSSAGTSLSCSSLNLIPVVRNDAAPTHSVICYNHISLSYIHADKLPCWESASVLFAHQNHLTTKLFYHLVAQCSWRSSESAQVDLSTIYYPSSAN